MQVTLGALRLWKKTFWSSYLKYETYAIPRVRDIQSIHRDILSALPSDSQAIETRCPRDDRGGMDPGGMHL